MAYSFLVGDAAINVDTQTATTSNLNTVTGDLLIGAESNYNGYAGGVISYSDSLNGAAGWNQLTPHTNAILHSVSIWYNRGGSVGIAQNFTAGRVGHSCYPSVGGAAVIGSIASPLDQQNGAISSSASSLQTGSITPSVNGCLVIAALAIGASVGSVSIDSGFTIIDQVDAGPTNVGLAFAYLVQGSAAAVNPTWSWTGAISVCAAIASFKPAAGATATWPGYQSPFGWH